MPQEATVRNLPQAYRVIKQMRLNGWEVAEEYREAARAAIRRCLRQRMLNARPPLLAALEKHPALKLYYDEIPEGGFAMVKVIGAIACALLVMSGTAAGAAPQPDVKGSVDHPLLTRMPEFRIGN